MHFRRTLGHRTYTFDSLKCLLAKATLNGTQTFPPVSFD